MKRLSVIVLLLVACPLLAQVKKGGEVTLITEGMGPTKDAATQNALRSAIEKTYGAFQSSSTITIGEDLVLDKTVTLSSGVVKSHEVISSVLNKFGEYVVSVKAVISPSELASFVKSKGAEVDFDGAGFGMNERLKTLEAENEKDALNNMYRQIRLVIDHHPLYSYSLTASNPQSIKIQEFPSDPTRNRKGWVSPLEKLSFTTLTVKCTENENMRVVQNIIQNMVNSISIPVSAVNDYQKVGLDPREVGSGRPRHYLRTEKNAELYEKIMRNIQDDLYRNKKDFTVSVRGNLPTANPEKQQGLARQQSMANAVAEQFKAMGYDNAPGFKQAEQRNEKDWDYVTGNIVMPESMNFLTGFKGLGDGINRPPKNFGATIRDTAEGFSITLYAPQETFSRITGFRVDSNR